jgi:hypothetical protein
VAQRIKKLESSISVSFAEGGMIKIKNRSLSFGKGFAVQFLLKSD